MLHAFGNIGSHVATHKDDGESISLEIRRELFQPTIRLMCLGVEHDL